MKKILIAYATMAGATAEVARTVGEEIARHGLQVDVLPLGSVKTLAGYDGVVLGGPMILGWHRAALGFLKQHRSELRQIPLAVFVLAMSLTESSATTVGGVPICLDDKLPKPPRTADRLSLRERYATLANYARPILNAARPARPVQIAFFGGRLEYGRLKWWAVLFAMLVVQAPAGDRRNWAAIRAWAAGLPRAFQLAPRGEEQVTVPVR